MNVDSLVPVIGTIDSLSLLPGSCDEFLLSLTTSEGPVNIILSADTFVVDTIQMHAGMRIAAFYDNMAPAPMIYPPQFRATLITAVPEDENIMLHFFDPTLTAMDQSLKLNIGPYTDVTTKNGQNYSCNPANKTLLVYYDATTRSIPPQTTPNRIIVF